MTCSIHCVIGGHRTALFTAAARPSTPHVQPQFLPVLNFSAEWESRSNNPAKIAPHWAFFLSVNFENCFVWLERGRKRDFSFWTDFSWKVLT